MEFKVGDRVRLTRYGGGDIKVGDEGKVVTVIPGGSWLKYRVWFDTMNVYCKRRGYWVGGEYYLELVSNEINEEELYY